MSRQNMELQYIPSALDQLRRIVPTSIFSNMRMDTLLSAIGLERTCREFEEILKPA